MIDTFIEKFTKEKLVNSEDVYQLGDDMYLVPPKLFSLGKNLPRKPIFAGTFLGRRRRSFFVPGIHLLDLLSNSKKT